MRSRILIFIVSYNAEAFIESVLNRIPSDMWHNPNYEIEVLVIDDQSGDDTFYRVSNYMEESPDLPISLLYNPVNQGYGGNQKLGYHYAIQNGFDAVVLLHGDGQYAPEYLDHMIQPIMQGEADVVLGSRMLQRFDALKGGMPLYKWLGNQVLTTLQNGMLNVNLAEFHTGYRAYSTKALSQVPFEYNSNYFDFDTDILIQMVDSGQRIKEIPIPTYYGEEISYVNGWKYGALIVATTLRSRITKLNLLYDRRFDYEQTNEHYTIKLGYPSSHQFALDLVESGKTVLDIGSGPGHMTKLLHDKGAQVISLDRYITAKTKQHSIQTIETEVENYEVQANDLRVDCILMLDIIEHIKEPEAFLLKLRNHYAQGNAPELVITTGNVAFFIVRFMLFLGQFNYGKKGILDRDHHRLFTFGSLKRALRSTGYDIHNVSGIPAPYPVAIGDNVLSRFLLKVNQILIWVLPGLFAYQIAIVAKPRPTVKHLLADAYKATDEKLTQGESF